MSTEPQSGLPHGPAFEKNIKQRRIRGTIWRNVFFSALAIALVSLILLIYNFSSNAFGIVAVQYKVDPATLTDKPIEELDQAELITILNEELRSTQIRKLEREQPLAERTQQDLYSIFVDDVLGQEVVESWNVYNSLFKRAEIEARVAEKYPRAELEFRSWLNAGFVSTTMSDNPLVAGIRTALLGSLWMILITLLVAFPIGVGASIYLEEYANDNWLNRIIQTNINNLAGVPSIIYGMLGLAIFVRALQPLTSGSMFGIEGNDTGRTVLAAGLTMALLILPIIIINAQEAIRAVPRSLRQASFGLGATKWQTIWHHVLPNALPGILTGTILAVSRAIGETAPLIVVGASTYIVADPSGPFSKFTALPIQIYNWTSQPQAEFQNIAAAAIIALLILLLSLNSLAVYLRNRFSRRI